MRIVEHPILDFQRGEKVTFTLMDSRWKVIQRNHCRCLAAGYPGLRS